MGETRQDVRGPRQDLDGTRQEVRDLRQEVREEAVRTRRHFDVTAEHLRGDVRLVAEGVVTNAAGIDRLRGEMNERFATSETVLLAAFTEVRRDIAALRF